MSVFTGLSAFPITPTDSQGRVKTDELSGLLKRLKDAGVSSVGLLGSTGTYMFLSRSERRCAIETGFTTVKSDIPLIVGIGALRTSDVIAHAKDAEDDGASGLLIAPVSYTPLTDLEVFEHFKALCQVTSLPICVYNNPSTTNFNFSTDLLARLAELPNIIAVKMPIPPKDAIASDITNLRAALPSDFLIGYSGDWGCAEALLCDAPTWYSVIGGILPQMTMKLANAAMSGKKAETERLNRQLEPIWALFQEFGSLRVVYSIARQLSLTTAEPPLPIRPIPTEAEPSVEHALNELETLE